MGIRSGWIIDSFIDYIINISKYNPLAGSSYTKLLKELGNPRKGFINDQKIDHNKCFKWSIVRYLNPANYHPAKITIAEKKFAKKLDFENEIQKRNPSALVLLLMKKGRTCCEEKHWFIINRRRRKKTLYCYQKF